MHLGACFSQYEWVASLLYRIMFVPVARAKHVGGQENQKGHLRMCRWPF
jgi:hypothetical protein